MTAFRKQLIAAVTLTVAVFAWSLREWLPKRMDDVDEAAVYFSTYYYHLAFHAHDFTSPDWAGRDALDHPPFWKYVHGAAFDLAGMRVTTVALKDDWHERAWLSGPPSDTFLADMRRALPPDALAPGRLLSAGCAAAAALVLFALAWRWIGPVGAWLAWAFFAFNNAVRYVSGRALIDALFALLVLSAAALQVLWLERGPARGRVAPGWAAALGLLLGAVVNTKINGVISVGAAGLSLVLVVWTARPRLSVATASLAVMLGCFFASAVALNPTLWRDPIGMAARMVETRWTIVATQQLLFDGAGLTTLPQAASAFLERTLMRTDPLWMPIRIPAFVLLFALGVVHVARDLPRREVLAANALAWIGGTALLFRINWARYTVPAVPWVGVLVALGIVHAAGAVRAWRSRPSKAALALALALGALIAVPRLWRPDPRDAAAQRVQTAERLLGADPALTAPRFMLLEARERAQRDLVHPPE